MQVMVYNYLFIILIMCTRQFQNVEVFNTHTTDKSVWGRL